MATIPEAFLTPEEYLAQERLAFEKSEYIDGRVYAMSGGSEHHSLIGTNVTGALWQQLRARGCRVYGSDLRVSSARGRRFFYPDASVICGASRYHDDHRDTVTNPVVLFEVLSETTEAYDKGSKFLSYQGITSLREYVLIHQAVPLVEHYLRAENESWTYHKVEGTTSTLALPSVQCTLELSDIYLSVFQA